VPEGDVVWRTARRLHSALAGRTLSVADLRWPRLSTLDLVGRSVVEVVSRGKHLLVRLDDGLTVHSHLRMDGSWRVRKTGPRLPGGSSATQIRAVLGNPAWTAIGYQLGMLDVLPTAEEARVVGHLGPDLLGTDWDAGLARRNLLADPDRPVGEALLDQRVLAGIGAFYLAETCFLRGVTPWTPVGEVPDPDKLLDLAHRLIVANANRAVQVTTGDARQGRSQWVHARAGRACRRCGTTVRSGMIGTAPTERVTYWCPHCQPGTSPGG
jgi:endonuclease VIII